MISFGLFTNPWNINTLNETNLHFRNSLPEEQLRYAQKIDYHELRQSSCSQKSRLKLILRGEKASVYQSNVARRLVIIARDRKFVAREVGGVQE